MTGRLILLTDLDDTLFQSARKRPEGISGRAATLSKDGEPSSYQCPRQQRIWAGLSAMADIVVPVTGRTTHALERVGILPERPVSVASHGALVLEKDQIDRKWKAQLDDAIPVVRRQLEEAHAELTHCLNSRASQPLRFHILEDMGVPVYLSIKGETPLDTQVQQCLIEVATHNRLTLHINDRNGALRPGYACKKDACGFVLEHIIKRQPEDTIITFGDSLSDLPFMGHGDVAMTPVHSQVWNSLKELAQ